MVEMSSDDVRTLVSEAKEELRREMQVRFEQKEEILKLQISNLESTNDRLMKNQRDNIIDTIKAWISTVEAKVTENTSLFGELKNEVFRGKIDNNKKPTSGHVENADNSRKANHTDDWLEDIEGRVRYLENELELCQNQLDNVEDQSRRNNVKFYGIAESSSWETWEQSESAVRDVMKHLLQLSNVDEISITRAHRLGRKGDAGDDPRPIIVKFDFYNHRQAVLKASGKLKDKPIKISEDFCARTSEYRKNVLKPRMIAARENGKYAVMRHRRLIIRDNKLPTNAPEDNVTDTHQTDAPKDSTDNIPTTNVPEDNTDNMTPPN